MRIIVNGNEQQLTDRTSIAALLKIVGVHPEQVVAEHNGQIIAADHYGKIYLSDGDTIELIQFVGGG
jgi:thiamine biosynthesis protein ThiS